MFNWEERSKVRDMGNGKVRTAGVAMGMQGSCISNVDVGSATLKLSEDGTYNLIIGACANFIGFLNFKDALLW